ncbi:hypothetical protein Tco_0866783 [Tanacetum coccineum]
MSADSAVTYTFVHSEARSWSIPSEDPYEEAAQQLLEQAPRSPEYVPDPMELEDHVPVYILGPVHHEVGESSAAAAARQPGPTMAYRVDYSLIDTMETSCEELRLSGQAADDLAVQHIMRTQALEAGARVDTLEALDLYFWISSSSIALLSINVKMAPKRTTRSTPVTPTPNATPTTTVTEAQLQALNDQGVSAAMAEAEASRVRNGYNSNGSGPKPAQTARECSYCEFLKCKPLDFKGTEGVVELTRWFEKIESMFSISNCTTSCQVKFATCTLQDLKLS